MPNSKTLQEYLQDCQGQGTIDHALRVDGTVDGLPKVYIHPSGIDGDTLDFLVEENTLLPIPETVHQACGSCKWSTPIADNWIRCNFILPKGAVRGYGEYPAESDGCYVWESSEVLK